MIRHGLAAGATLLASVTLCEAQQAVRWTSLDNIDRYSRSYVRLDEEESVKEIKVARVRLREKTGSSDVDALFVYHRNSMFCGSAGCLFEVLLTMPDGTMSKVLEVNVNDVALGKSFTRGVRNLRFDNAVTWVWNGQTYVLK